MKNINEIPDLTEKFIRSENHYKGKVIDVET